MSYSFNVSAATKAAAVEKVVAELDKVVAAQPVHAADRAQAQATAEAFVNIVPDPKEDQEIYVSVSGWVNWTSDLVVTAASVNVSATVKPKE